MKLNYKIIWVEDKINERPFQNNINAIKNFLAEKFFDVQFETAEDFDEFKSKFNENGTFDLVITDYSLNDSHGNEVIDFIRMDKNVLTEVFFYSANAALRNVPLANSSRISFYILEGAGYHNRLLSKIEELIALTISKFEHIVSMRGMIMHETSLLDQQTLEMVNDYVINNDDEARVKLYNELVSYFGEKYNLATKCQNNNNINKIIKVPLLLTSNQRANVLSTIIQKKGLNDFINEFKTEVISIRNKFAHAVLEIDENGSEFFSNKNEQLNFDSDLCKKIRRDIIKHKKNLDELKTTIKHNN